MALATAGAAMIRTPAAIVLVLLVAPPLTLAQDTSERPDGVICRQPECDIRRSLPLHIQGREEAEAELVQRVKDTPASTLEAGLPQLAFESWLFLTLRDAARGGDHPFSHWSLSFCDERASATPRAGPDWCVEVRVPAADGRVVNIYVRVTSTENVDGRPEWRAIVPVVHDIFIEREQDSRTLDSLDVSGLLDIPDRLRLPFDEWPIVDLKTTVTWSPQQPRPGQVVRFTFSIANLGGRDAHRAEITIYISVPQNNELKEIRRSWFPRIPAGTTVSLDISVQLGRGDATIVAQAAPKETFRRMRAVDADAVNTADDEVVVEIPLFR